MQTPSGMFSQATVTPPLPLVLDLHERRLPLNVGAEADNPQARFSIHIWTQGGDDDKLWMRLNHHLLEPELADGEYSVDVPSGMLHSGGNEFTIFCGTKLSSTSSPLIVREVLLEVTY